MRMMAIIEKAAWFFARCAVSSIIVLILTKLALKMYNAAGAYNGDYSIMEIDACTLVTCVCVAGFLMSIILILFSRR